MIKAIIFDMDGVLVDATEWHYEALNRALGVFGFTITRQEHLDRYNGLPTRVKLQMLTNEKGLPPGLHRFINELKQKYTAEVVLEKCRPSGEKLHLLEKLFVQGYKIAVCSNAIRESVRNMLERSQLLKYCVFFLSNEDVKTPKPAPDMYIEAIRRLGLKPSECLIVEDSPTGIQSARGSGAHVLEVSGFHDVHYAAIFNKINEINMKEGGR
jgi:beta-phosphoglucomutase